MTDEEEIEKRSEAETAEIADNETDQIIEHIEKQVNDDIIPYIIIMAVKVAIKYGIDINWMCRAIQVGFYNKDGPQSFRDHIDNDGKIKYDS